jgi:hypothetical protein
MGTRARVALALAAVWGIGLLVAALTLPVYDVESRGHAPGGTPVVTSGSATLVGVNGPGVLVVAAAPLASALVVGALLAARPRHPAAGVAAWGIVALLAALAVVGLLSVGVLLVPAVVALAVATSAPRPAVVHSAR